MSRIIPIVITSVMIYVIWIIQEKQDEKYSKKRIDDRNKLSDKEKRLREKYEDELYE